MASNNDSSVAVVAGVALLLVGGAFLVLRPDKEEIGQTKRKAKTRPKQRGYNLDTRSNWRIRWYGKGGHLMKETIDRSVRLEDARHLGAGTLYGGFDDSPSSAKPIRWSIEDTATGKIIMRGTKDRETPIIPIPGEPKLYV